MRVKTYKKSSSFWKHGKHKTVLGQVRRQEREKIERPKELMFGSVKEAFEAAKKKK